MSRIFFIVNDGEVTAASKDVEMLSERCEELNDTAFNETAEEMGVDLDDATEKDIQEVAFQQGFDGGYHYVDSVDIPDVFDTEEVFTTRNGDELTYGDVIEKLDC